MTGTEQRLLSQLLRNYDVDARGVDDVNDTVNVVVEFLLLRIQGLVCTPGGRTHFSKLHLLRNFTNFEDCPDLV